MTDESSLDKEISKIMFHLENCDTDMFENSEYQEKILSIANEALKSGHAEGDYLLSIVSDLKRDPSKGVDLKLKAAVKGNSNAIMEYVNRVGPNNITSMALLMARKNAMGSDTASPYQDYDYILETCDKKFLSEVTELANSINQNLEKKGLEFSW